MSVINHYNNQYRTINTIDIQPPSSPHTLDVEDTPEGWGKMVFTSGSHTITDFPDKTGGALVAVLVSKGGNGHIASVYTGGGGGASGFGVTLLYRQAFNPVVSLEIGSSTYFSLSSNIGQESPITLESGDSANGDNGEPGSILTPIPDKAIETRNSIKGDDGDYHVGSYAGGGDGGIMDPDFVPPRGNGGDGGNYSGYDEYPGEEGEPGAIIIYYDIRSY